MPHCRFNIKNSIRVLGVASAVMAAVFWLVEAGSRGRSLCTDDYTLILTLSTAPVGHADDAAGLLLSSSVFLVVKILLWAFIYR